VWRAAGLVSYEQLFVVSIAFLLASLVFVVAGWYHHHRAVPMTSWFNDVDAILTHHLTAVVGLGSLAWAGHLVHVSIPMDALLRLGLDAEGLVTNTPLASTVQGVVLGSSGAAVFGLDWRAAVLLSPGWVDATPLLVVSGYPMLYTTTSL
jgi:hypothetical protein